ncbi:hypothetical protein [Stenotrophomonas maltophilia]|uniref:hypothetical protein n=1 Tax=Stenotrophomonas maltophilia TaxID=40324 RepID=UPI0034DB3C5F
MSRRGIRPLQLLLCLVALPLAACQPNADRPAPVEAQAAREDLVPLVRPMPTEPADAPLVVEFDLEPPPRNASPTLFIGIRVNATADEQAAAALRSAGRDGLQAEVAMKRLQANGAAGVPLKQLEMLPGGGGSYVPLPADGRVSGGWVDDADPLSLEAAGLEIRGDRYAQLALAAARDLPPGRYQVSVRLLAPLPELQPYRPELLVAYSRRPK